MKSHDDRTPRKRENTNKNEIKTSKLSYDSPKNNQLVVNDKQKMTSWCRHSNIFVSRRCIADSRPFLVKSLTFHLKTKKCHKNYCWELRLRENFGRWPKFDGSPIYEKWLETCASVNKLRD